MVRVERSERLISLGNIAYIRVGTSKRPLSIQEIFWKGMESGELRWDSQASGIRFEDAEEKYLELYFERLEKLRKRILELVPEDKFDESRFLQEVTIFADRSDITEELVRAESHVGQFMEILEQGGTIGKKMEFLLQELSREINTIGSKANSVDIAGLVVEMKNEVEKIREQVQNIE